MLLPSLVELQGRCGVTFVGREPGLGLLRRHAHNAMDFEGPGWRLLLMNKAENGALPVSHAEKVVAFLSDPDGLIRRNLRRFYPQASIHMFPSLPGREERIHVALYAARCLHRAGLPVDPQRAIARAMDRGLLLRNHGVRSRTLLVCHPGSGSPAKNYDTPFWMELIQRLKPLVLLGPAEKDLYPFFREEAEEHGIQILPCPSMEALCDLLKSARLYIGHDSGITHLAAMLEAPTMALFRSSDATLWKPLGPYVRTIYHGAGGSPAFAGEVIEAARTLLR